MTTALEQAELDYDGLLDQFGELVAHLKARGGPSDTARVRLADEWRHIGTQGDRLEALRDRQTLREIEALEE